MPFAQLRSFILSLSSFAFLQLPLAPEALWSQTAAPAPPLVFVSRAILPTGSVFWSVPNTMPGVGAHSRFRVAAPGRLLVRESNGAIRILVDGANPTAASLNLIDVNAPDVSYDGTKIVFAGFAAGEYDPLYDSDPLADPDGWRLYVIGADGSGLRQLTFSDQDNLDYSQFGQTASSVLPAYDDTDPVWLPDGRIAFSSTRWPAFAQYSAARATNLYMVNADGSGLHRITAERNGADRAVVDPLTGRIVFSRWWRNQRFPTNDMTSVPNNTYTCCPGFDQKDGLTRDRINQAGGPDVSFRNAWHLASINPDGTGLRQFAGPHHASDGAQAYGGAFGPNGEIVANYFPMTNLSEAAGFGGLRRYRRGEIDYQPILGVTARYEPDGTENVVNPSNPRSYGVIKGAYAGEPAVLPDGRIVFSWAADIKQDYGLYVIDANGGARTLLYDVPGRTELRAKILQPRPKPPIIPDQVNTYASLLPPQETGPYDIGGTFAFDSLNVYGNAPVDTIEASAPAVGSAAKIRFFADFQRLNWGSLEMLDWPILLAEKDVAPNGSVRANAPANLQLFEQLRSGDGTVPLTMGEPLGVAHVAGMNYGKPGEVARCIGCHAGHTMIPLPANDADAKWTNLAPGAQVEASSTRNAVWDSGIVDRRVMKGPIENTWASDPAASGKQWVQLVFPEAVTVRTVRLYNVRSTEGSTLQVHNATVRLGLPHALDWVASAGAQEIAVSGTDVAFPDVEAQTVRVEIDSVSGLTDDGYLLSSLAEIEVIARAGDANSGGAAGGAKAATYTNGLWYVDANGSGALEGGSDPVFGLGFPGAQRLVGDWNGDGRDSAGVYSQGFWFLDSDGDGAFEPAGADLQFAFGFAGATPVVGDWDGDGDDDAGVYARGFWFLDFNGDRLWEGPGTDRQFPFGFGNAKPIVGDWNGDGADDPAFFLNGVWFLDADGSMSWDGGVLDRAMGFGAANDVLMVGDWDGDGADSPAFYSSNGYWFQDYDGDFVWDGGVADRVFTFGKPGAVPVAGDWNGDGRDSAGVFSGGWWYLDRNGDGAFEGPGDVQFQFGDPAGAPAPGRW